MIFFLIFLYVFLLGGIIGFWFKDFLFCVCLELIDVIGLVIYDCFVGICDGLNLLYISKDKFFLIFFNDCIVLRCVVFKRLVLLILGDKRKLIYIN